jgi:kynurenine formamidase
MPRKLIDLSVPFEDRPTVPAMHRPEIEYRTHDQTVESFARYHPGVTRDDLPDGVAWASERVTIETHAGTHMDAPWHFHPTMDHALVAGGRRSSTIDEVPLDWCLQPGVKLDFRHFAAGHVASAGDVARELDRIGHALKPLEIVLVNTAAAVKYGQPDYWESHCGMGREATLFLLERGVRVVGTDAWGWDAPFSITAERWKQSRDNSILWEGHKAGRDIGYFQMEKLTNLDLLPPHGFTVACFPLKVKGASAGWTRAVAILEG